MNKLGQLIFFHYLKNSQSKFKFTKKNGKKKYKLVSKVKKTISASFRNEADTKKIIENRGELLD